MMTIVRLFLSDEFLDKLLLKPNLVVFILLNVSQTHRYAHRRNHQEVPERVGIDINL